MADIKDLYLPETLPVFPLAGAVLPPSSVVALRIFEPRYIRLVNDALKNGRYMVLTQPIDEESDDALYNIAGMGRITNFEESPNGEYNITILGMQRVILKDELPIKDDDIHPFRKFTVDYTQYGGDNHAEEDSFLDKEHIFNQLKKLFNSEDFQVNWDLLFTLSDKKILSLILITAPFSAAEKQAVLETNDFAGMAQKITTLIEMALFEEEDAPSITKN